jgi:hypothetical protein
VLLATAALAWASVAFAWPKRVLRLVIGFQAGGSLRGHQHLAAEHVSTSLNCLSASLALATARLRR